MAFGRFSGRGYVKGIAFYSGHPIRFLCQYTNDYDEEHNPGQFAALRSSFFKSFNSSKVWKENPAP